MKDPFTIPTSRIEAFSDGVIAIIITVMVFDLKLTSVADETNIWDELLNLSPKFASYVLSFLVVGIMWVNHHQLFHQIKNTDRNLLWLSINLLFWMSLVPFATNLIGSSPLLYQSSVVYGVVFGMSAFAFALLRNYVVKKDLLHTTIRKEQHIKIRNKNRLAMGIYLSAALLSFLSVYVSFGLFLVVPAMYFIPEKINHQEG